MDRADARVYSSTITTKNMGYYLGPLIEDLERGMDPPADDPPSSWKASSTEAGPAVEGPVTMGRRSPRAQHRSSASTVAPPQSPVTPVMGSRNSQPQRTGNRSPRGDDKARKLLGEENLRGSDKSLALSAEATPPRGRRKEPDTRKMIEASRSAIEKLTRRTEEEKSVRDIVASYWSDTRIALTGRQQAVEAALLDSLQWNGNSDEAANAVGRHICFERGGGHVRLAALCETDSGPQLATLLATREPINADELSWSYKELTKLSDRLVLAKIKKATPKERNYLPVSVCGDTFYASGRDVSRFTALVWGKNAKDTVGIEMPSSETGSLAVYLDGERVGELATGYRLFLSMDLQAHIAWQWASFAGQAAGKLKGEAEKHLRVLCSQVDRKLDRVLQWRPDDLDAVALPDTYGQEKTYPKAHFVRANLMQEKVEQGLAEHRSWPDTFSAMVQAADMVFQALDPQADSELMVRAGSYETVSRRLPKHLRVNSTPSPLGFANHCRNELASAYAVENVDSAKIWRAKKVCYLPGDEVRSFLQRVTEGYNFEALQPGLVKELQILTDGSISVDLCEAAAQQLFEHELTLVGKNVTAYNRQLIPLLSHNQWPAFVNLSDPRDKNEIPKGYIKVVRPVEASKEQFLPPLFLTEHSLRGILNRLTCQMPSPFTSEDFSVEYTSSAKVIAKSPAGCQQLFSRSSDVDAIAPGSSIECFFGEPNRIKEHIERTLPDPVRTSGRHKPPQRPKDK